MMPDERRSGVERRSEPRGEATERRMGRPPLVKGERAQPVTTNLTLVEHAALTRISIQSGVSLSALVRSAVRRMLNKPA